MFGWELPPFNSGGLGVACDGLARALSHQQVDVTFVLPRRTDVKNSSLHVMFADEEHISVEAIQSLLSPYMTSSQYKTLRDEVRVDSVYGKTLYDEVIRYGMKAQKLARKLDFDIIHAHEWLSFAAGLAAKRVSGKPLVVHVHATEFDRSGWQGVNPQVYNLEKEAFEQADCIIAVSQYTKNIIVDHYGIRADKIFVVHNGITPEEAQGPSNEPNILELKRKGNKMVLFVGRLTLHKGPDFFLRAAQKVVQYIPNVIFVIAGSGEMEHQLINEVAALGIGDKVFFTGFLRGDELKRLYKSADLCVFPSISEPFGLTTLESLINGTPVLVSKQSGVSEILSHTLKADFWDVDDIVDKILAVLQYGPLMESLSKNGNREANGITWKKAAEKCIAVYKRMMSHL